MTVTVGEQPNQPPVVSDDTAGTTSGEPVTVEVLGNGSDPEGGALTVTDVSQPANRTATLNPDGTITYTPNPGFTGQDSFEYTITEPSQTLLVTSPPIRERRKATLFRRMLPPQVTAYCKQAP